jgi:hypothetical protein
MVKLTIALLAAGVLNSATEEQFTFLGMVEKVTRNEITVKTPRGSFQIGAGDGTAIEKDRTYGDYSALKIGDEISARCRPDASGKLIAVKVWAKPVDFIGAVRSIQGDEAIVDIKSAAESRTVRLYPDTVFGTSRRDVVPGKQVRINGVETGPGAADATRVAVYNTGVPARQNLK